MWIADNWKEYEVIDIAGYIMLAVLVCVILFRIITLRKQKRISEEKTRFFINTAHDLSLIHI